MQAYIALTKPLKMTLKTHITYLLFILAYTVSPAQSHMDNCIPEPDLLNGQPVYTIVDQMPEYPGGQEALMKFLAKNTKYPALKGNENFDSKVYVTFIVDTNGEVVNECVINIYSRIKLNALELEVLRVAKLLPLWKPGRQNGKKVPVRYVLPTLFCLD